MASDEELAARLQAMVGTNDTDLAARVQQQITERRPAMKSALRGVVRGATLGTNDEIRGAITGVGGLFTGEGFGPAYERGRDAERALDAADDAAHPVLSTAGQIYGGVGGAIGGGAVAGAAGLTNGLARLAAPVAARINPLLSGLPTWAGGAARVVSTGAAGGGAAGFGEGQGGFGARVENATEGAALGAGAGAILGGGVRVGAGVAGRVGHAFGLRNPEVAAERHILRAMERSGVDTDQAAAALTAGGDAPLALVDVGGRNTVNLGRVAANTPGEAVEAADQFVQMRRGSRPDRLMNAGDEAFGGGSGAAIAETQAAREAQRAREAGPLYDRVRAFGEVNDPDVTETLLRLPDRVFGQASEFARLGGRSPERLIAQGEGGRQLSRVPTTEDLDHVARALADEISAAQRAGNNGLARELTIARTGLLARLDDIIVDPETGERIYAAARRSYAEPSALIDATEAGRTALRTNRDEVAATMRDAIPDVQDAYRLGAGRDFSDRVSDPARASGAARQMLEDHQMQARLNALLPPEARGRLNEVLRREVDMTAVERAVSPRAGSQTGALIAGGEDMARDPMGPAALALMQLTSGQPIAATGTVARDLWRRAGQGINPATADALANRLFSTDPAARAGVIEALRNRRINDLMRQQQARATLRPVLQGVGAGAGLTAD